MKRFLKMYKVEQALFMRSPDVILFQLLMPLAAFLLIALIGGSKTAGNADITYIESSYAALTTVGICCSSFMSIPLVIVDNRARGVLRRMYCSPCSPFRLLACDGIASGVMAVISTILLTIAAVIAGYRMEGSPVIFAVCWLLTLVSMFSIGFMVASLCRTTKSLNVVTSLLYFPMLLFSGATIPAEIFPAAMQKIAGIMPLGLGINVLKSVSKGVYSGLTGSALVLTAFFAVCTAVAVKTFRWE